MSTYKEARKRIVDEFIKTNGDYYSGKKDLAWIGAPLCIITDPRISNSEKLVYSILCTYEKCYEGNVYPSMGTLANMLGVDRRTIITIIKKMTQNLLIVSIPFQGENSNYLLINPKYLKNYNFLTAEEMSNPNFFLANYSKPNGFAERVMDYTIKKIKERGIV